MTQGFETQVTTAVVTPFKADGSVDHAALGKLIQHLIDTGSDGILVNGSTGESPTTSREEKRAIMETARRVIGNQPVTLVAGTGTNNTHTTLDLCRDAQAVGVDALLVVVPYYNKPSQKGLIAHYQAVLEAVDTPVIIYNIPSRSVITMSPDTMAYLAAFSPQMVGVKQSHPDMDQVSEIRMKTPSAFQIWSGDDSLTLPMMSLGATGVFSVASHVAGRPIQDMVQAIQQGRLAEALALHLQLMPLFKGLFVLPNPTVVKACLAQLGHIEPVYRLPLLPPDETETACITGLIPLIQQLSQQQACSL